jgi:hypothetical protein
VVTGRQTVRLGRVQAIPVGMHWSVLVVVHRVPAVVPVAGSREEEPASPCTW